jgi:hypothetical protein
VPRVVYGADDRKGGGFRSCFEILTSAILNHRVEVTSGLLAEESGSLLQAFFFCVAALGQTRAALEDVLASYTSSCASPLETWMRLRVTS